MVFISSVAELMVRISADINSLERGLNNANNGINGMVRNAEKGSKILLGAFGVMGAGALAFGVSSVKMASDMEMTEKSFETLLGNTKDSEKLLKDLANFAKKTPFDLIGLQKSSKQLLAYGFDAQEIIPMMEKLGDGVSAVGGGTDGIDRVVRALGKILPSINWEKSVKAKILIFVKKFYYIIMNQYHVNTEVTL